MFDKICCQFCIFIIDPCPVHSLLRILVHYTFTYTRRLNHNLYVKILYSLKLLSLLATGT